jgi:polar amino acid transport system permease protein
MAEDEHGGRRMTANSLASDRPGTVAPVEHDVATARRRHRPWHWVLSAVLLLLLAQFVNFVLGNKSLEWGTVAKYLFEPSILKGLGTSVLLTVVTIVLGTVIGVICLAMSMSAYPPARWLVRIYVAVFRSIPPLVQLIFWFNLLPRLSLGVPFGPVFGSWETNALISPLTAAILGLTLHEGAYMAEIIRAGVLGVDEGQRVAAKAMGFNGRQTFVRIVLPQAMRTIIPPTGSQFITILKGTSLVSVIAMGDLLFSVQAIYNQTYEIVPLLTVACFWYLVVVLVLSAMQRRLEKRFARGHDREAARPRRKEAP